MLLLFVWGEGGKSVCWSSLCCATGPRLVKPFIDPSILFSVLWCVCLFCVKHCSRATGYQMCKIAAAAAVAATVRAWFDLVTVSSPILAILLTIMQTQSTWNMCETFLDSKETHVLIGYRVGLTANCSLAADLMETMWWRMYTSYILVYIVKNDAIKPR